MAAIREAGLNVAREAITRVAGLRSIRLVFKRR
jgi:hypothetical protein